MVAGRLNREVNPTPGEKPGFTPQHKKLDGTYVDTGEEFNLPTNDAATQAKLDSSIAELQNLKTELQAQKAQLQGIIDGTSPANTKLTGSTVDLRGLNSNKPLASSVEVGTTYWSVDTDPQGDAVEISDGTNWTVI